MPSEDPANFPDIPIFSDEKYHEMTAGTMRAMIRRTVFASASEMARYTMTGALWELEKDSVRLVATDGRRLAWTQEVPPSTAAIRLRGNLRWCLARR